MTLAALAGRVGLSRSTLSRIETGASRPSLDAISRIVEATGGLVGAADFLPDTAHRSREPEATA